MVRSPTLRAIVGPSPLPSFLQISLFSGIRCQLGLNLLTMLVWHICCGTQAVTVLGATTARCTKRVWVLSFMVFTVCPFATGFRGKTQVTKHV